MPAAAITGTYSYGGYSFDGSSRCTAEFRPVEDEARRTIVCIELEISVTWIVQDDAATDVALMTLSAQLSKQGKALIFINKGLGTDLSVNSPATGSTLWDIKSGPIPQPLTWKPIGDKRACEVTWRCLTYLPPQCVSEGGGLIGRIQQGVMALNYGCTFSINEKGYTTRTTMGYLEVAQTRNGRVILDSADNYWESNIGVAQLPDFHRESSREVDYSKSRLNFTIIDRQIESPNAYAPGVVKMKANHRTRTSIIAGQPMRYSGSISLDVETSAVHSKLFGLKAFLDIVRLRLGAAGLLSDSPLFIDSLEIDEELFDQSCSYSLSYRLLKKVPDFAIFQHWTPLGSDWRLWKQSLQLAGAPHTPRGLANLGLNQANDVIVDLCGSSSVPWVDPSPRSDQYQPPGAEYLRNKPPKPQESWLSYHQTVTPGREQPVTRQAPLQTPDTSQDTDDMQSTSGFQLPPQGGTSDILQKSGRHRYWVELSGAASRVGFTVPRPALQSVGDQTPTETSCVFREWSGGDHLGVEVHNAAWIVRYALPNSPGAVFSKPNLGDGQ
jgi:hypothetical protein